MIDIFSSNFPIIEYIVYWISVIIQYTLMLQIKAIARKSNLTIAFKFFYISSFFLPLLSIVSAKTSPLFSTAILKFDTTFIKNVGKGTSSFIKFSNIDINSLIISHIDTKSPKNVVIGILISIACATFIIVQSTIIPTATATP